MLLEPHFKKKMLTTTNRTRILSERSRSKMPGASMKFANGGIPSVMTTIPVGFGFTPLLPRHEVRTIIKSIKRNHGKGIPEDDYISVVSLELSRQLEKFYSLEVIRTTPHAPSPSVPLSIITPNGKSENVNFYVVKTEDMVALEQVFDILSEIFRIMMLYELKDAVMAEVDKILITVSSDLKPMTKTVEDCLNHLDKIENDVNADILNTLLKTLLIVKTDLFSWWPLVGISEVKNQWDKVVGEIVNEILEKEKEKEHVVHRFCSFANPVVDIGNFNAEEARKYLKDRYYNYINDPNTIFV